MQYIKNALPVRMKFNNKYLSIYGNWLKKCSQIVAFITALHLNDFTVYNARISITMSFEFTRKIYILWKVYKHVYVKRFC